MLFTVHFASTSLSKVAFFKERICGYSVFYYMQPTRRGGYYIDWVFILFFIVALVRLRILI